MQPCTMESSTCSSSSALAHSFPSAASVASTSMAGADSRDDNNNSVGPPAADPLERSSSSLSSYSSASTASAVIADQEQRDRELAAQRSEAPSPTPSTLSTLSLSGLLERSEAEQQLGTAVAPDHVPESSALRRIRIFTGSSSSASSSEASSSLDRNQGATGVEGVPATTTLTTGDQPDYLLSSLVGGHNNRRRRSSAAYFVAVGGAGLSGAPDEPPSSPSLLFGPGSSVVSNVVRGIHSFTVTPVPSAPPTSSSAPIQQQLQSTMTPPLPLSPVSSPSTLQDSAAATMAPPPSAAAARPQPPGSLSPRATHPKTCASSATGAGLVVRSPRQSMYTADPLGLPPSASLVTAIPPVSPASSKSPTSPAAPPAAATELAAAPASTFHQHFPRRPRPVSNSTLGLVGSSSPPSPPPPAKLVLSIDTHQHEQEPRTDAVAVPRPHSPEPAPQSSAAPHSPNPLVLHPMQRALIDRLASTSDDPALPHAAPPPPEAAAAGATGPAPRLSPGSSTQQSSAPGAGSTSVSMGIPGGGGGGAMPAFRAIVTTDVRGTVRTANDRFSALVAHLIPRTLSGSIQAAAPSPVHSPASSVSSSSTSPTLGHSTASSPRPKKPPIRKGFVVFDLDTHPEPTRAGSHGSGMASPVGGATPDGSPAPAGRALLFGAGATAASPQKAAATASGVSMIGTNVLDLIVPGHREKIAKKVGKKVEAIKRRVAGAGAGESGEVDEVLVAGRIVRSFRCLVSL
ncbi:hypothetical protein BCR44DRAFT_311025 [Catenaria anguillulae PL171]|uniref:Uncharacterized protein n=1 Tax=Catenaria anguillulae PL171 TaxID=765915 RepID=A0A1Y2HUN8_9FUNG|nr:hypothetical protein BCR44DRAFT_311025 [Catenaria anguillulae PL171]